MCSLIFLSDACKIPVNVDASEIEFKNVSTSLNVSITSFAFEVSVNVLNLSIISLIDVSNASVEELIKPIDVQITSNLLLISVDTFSAYAFNVLTSVDISYTLSINTLTSVLVL